MGSVVGAEFVLELGLQVGGWVEVGGLVAVGGLDEVEVQVQVVALGAEVVVAAIVGVVVVGSLHLLLVVVGSLHLLLAEVGSLLPLAEEDKLQGTPQGRCHPMLLLRLLAGTVRLLLPYPRATGTQTGTRQGFRRVFCRAG